MNEVQEQKKKYIPPLIESMELPVNINAASGTGNDGSLDPFFSLSIRAF